MNLKEDDKLPQGWVIANLKEIANIKYGKNLLTKHFIKDGKYPVFGANGIIGYYDEYIYETEQVLISCRGANSGVINYSPPQCFITNNSLVLELLNSNYILPKLVYYALQSVDRTKLVTGTAQPQVTVENASPLEIPLPPLNEQKRIVAKLEKLLAKVNESCDRLSRIPTILKRFRQSVLASASSGRLTADWRKSHPKIEPAEKLLKRIQEERLCLTKTKNEEKKIVKKFDTNLTNFQNLPSNWFTLKAECLCDFITKGTTPKEITEIGEVPYLKVQHIIDNKIDFWSIPCFISKDTHENFLKRSKVVPRDVLMNIVGPPLNKVAIVSNDFPEWNINQALAIFRPVSSIIPEYIQIVLSHEGTISEILKETRGIVGQSNISLEQCRNLVIKVPPLEEQKEIVKRVQALFRKCDLIEQRYLKAKTYTDKLTQSILAKAFRGELVPQDSNDEPAKVLLQRIREGKTLTEKSSKSNKTSDRKTT